MKLRCGKISLPLVTSRHIVQPSKQSSWSRCGRTFGGMDVRHASGTMHRLAKEMG